MTDEQSVSERWYDANDIGGRNAFFRDLMVTFRKDHPREPFGENRRRLWQLIEKHGGSLDGRPTWLRIVSEMIDTTRSRLGRLRRTAHTSSSTSQRPKHAS